MGEARIRGRLKYIRRVKGRYQARPYDGITGERINLGMYPTEGAAAAAIDRYWWGKENDRPKYVRPRMLRDGSVRYFVVIRHAGESIWVGGVYKTSEAAARAVKRYITTHYPPEVAERMLSRREGPSATAGGRKEAARRALAALRRQDQASAVETPR